MYNFNKIIRNLKMNYLKRKLNINKEKIKKY